MSLHGLASTLSKRAASSYVWKRYQHLLLQDQFLLFVRPSLRLGGRPTILRDGFMKPARNPTRVYRVLENTIRLQYRLQSRPSAMRNWFYGDLMFPSVLPSRPLCYPFLWIFLFLVALQSFLSEVFQDKALTTMNQLRRLLSMT